jgi:hypothetical protein
MTQKRPKYWLWIAVIELVTGCLIGTLAWLVNWTRVGLPGWLYGGLLASLVVASPVVGGAISRKAGYPAHSARRLIAILFIASLCLGIAIPVWAAYTGPNRSTTTTVWDRQKCDYHATYGMYGCSLTLYHTTGGCDSAGSTAGYFNPTACVGWPGTCGVDFSCSISQTGSQTVGCNPGDAACTSHTVTTNLPPATVIGTTACATPGDAGWCRGGATLSLTGTDPVSGWTITAIESDLFGNLCTGNAPTLSCTWNFPEGSTSLKFWADSSHGDTSLMSSASMDLDSVPPSVSVSMSGTAGANGWYTSPVTFTGNATDPSPSSGIASTQYVLDGGAPQTGSSVAVSTDGAHTIFFTTQDVAGNVSAPSATDTVKIDQVPPSVSASVTGGTAGTNGWYTTPVQLTGTASDATSGLDAAGLSYTIDGGASQSGSVASVSGDGTHTVVFSARDMAGLLGSSTKTVKIDTTPPTAGFSIPPADGTNGWHKTSFTVTPNGSDATSGIASQQVSLDGSTWSPSVSITTDGVYTVYSRATDNAGNTSSIATQSVSLDTTPPTESLILPPTSSGWYNSQPAITVSASDATSGVATIEYSVDSGPWASSLPTFTDGTHTVQARVTDQAGNSSTSTISTIQVDTTPPQSIFISPAEGSTTVAVGKFTMTGTTTDATSGVEGAQISLDNGATWSALTVSGGSWSYVWDTGKFSNGTYHVLVSGTDVAGNHEHTAHITVVVANQGPDVSITPNWVIWQTAAIKITPHVLPVTGAHIVISHQGGYDVWDASYSGGNLPSSFKWNGITSKGTTAPAGFYTVKVEVWDGYGHQATASGTLWIPLPLLPVTPTPTPTSTPTPTKAAPPTAVPRNTPPPRAPTAAPTAVPPTPVPPVPTPVSSGAPKPLVRLEILGQPRVLFPALGIVGLFLAMAAASLSDQRYKTIRELSATLKAYGDQISRYSESSKKG